MPIDLEKLALLRSVSEALGERELRDVNLLLHELGLDDLPWNAWHDDRWEPTPSDRANTVLATIRDLPRADLDSISTAVQHLYSVTIDVSVPPDPEPLFIFASHLATQKAIVGAVGTSLSDWGVNLFVAHDSIEPDLEWQVEIERALRTCHAGLVFLMPGFIDSRWCDQEVGWMLGREVPCLALKFQHQDPYGPLGKKQALTVADEMTAERITLEVLDWAESKSELSQNFNTSLVRALQSSYNFNRTDRVWERLHNARDMNEGQVAGLLTAIRDNDQVYNASGGIGEERGPYAQLVFKHASAQPGFEANEQLAREVAQMRNLEHLLPTRIGPKTSEDPWASPRVEEPPF